MCSMSQCIDTIIWGSSINYVRGGVGGQASNTSPLQGGGGPDSMPNCVLNKWKVPRTLSVVITEHNLSINCGMSYAGYTYIHLCCLHFYFDN